MGHGGSKYLNAGKGKLLFSAFSERGGELLATRKNKLHFTYVVSYIEDNYVSKCFHKINNIFFFIHISAQLSSCQFPSNISSIQVKLHSVSANGLFFIR